MIDFRLTETDEAMLARLRAEALICRRYAREFDEREAERIPDVLPEAAVFEAEAKASPLPKAGPQDTPPAVMMMLQTMGACWGDYSIRLRRATAGGLGNAALMAAGTETQKAKWGHLLLSMAITEPGCGSDPSRVSTTAVLDAKTNEWVLNGEKIFVTTGIRADGVVLWATIDKGAGRAGIKSFLVVKGTPGFDVPHKEKKLGIRADDTAAYVFRDCRIPRENLLGGDESIPKQSSGGFRGVMKTFNMTRPLTAAMGLGIAEAALDATRDALAEAGVEPTGRRAPAAWAGSRPRPSDSCGSRRSSRRRNGPSCSAPGWPGRGCPTTSSRRSARRMRAPPSARSPRAASRSWAPWASPATTSSRSGCATAGSPTSTRAPARSSGSSSPAVCSTTPATI
ncbi:MAG: acyl-CoA dehydrogenase family protein [Myxococcota bacterium]